MHILLIECWYLLTTALKWSHAWLTPGRMSALNKSFHHGWLSYTYPCFVGENVTLCIIVGCFLCNLNVFFPTKIQNKPVSRVEMCLFKFQTVDDIFTWNISCIWCCWVSSFMGVVWNTKNKCTSIIWSKTFQKHFSGLGIKPFVTLRLDYSI